MIMGEIQSIGLGASHDVLDATIRIAGVPNASVKICQVTLTKIEGDHV